MTSVATSETALEVAKSLRPLLEGEADATDAELTMTQACVEAFTDTKLFHLMVPKEFGGLEADTDTVIDVFEELAHQEGSIGWSQMANASATAYCAFLDPEIGAEMVGNKPGSWCAGWCSRRCRRHSRIHRRPSLHQHERRRDERCCCCRQQQRQCELGTNPPGNAAAARGQPPADAALAPLLSLLLLVRSASPPPHRGGSLRDADDSDLDPLSAVPQPPGRCRRAWRVDCLVAGGTDAVHDQRILLLLLLLVLAAAVVVRYARRGGQQQ